MHGYIHIYIRTCDKTDSESICCMHAWHACMACMHGMHANMRAYLYAWRLFGCTCDMVCYTLCIWQVYTYDITVDPRICIYLFV